MSCYGRVGGANHLLLSECNPPDGPIIIELAIGASLRQSPAQGRRLAIDDGEASHQALSPLERQHNA